MKVSNHLRSMMLKKRLKGSPGKRQDMNQIHLILPVLRQNTRIPRRGPYKAKDIFSIRDKSKDEIQGPLDIWWNFNKQGLFLASHDAASKNTTHQWACIYPLRVPRGACIESPETFFRVAKISLYLH
ncbi:uncharacterized protein LOC141892262 [Acropora palmata]|uniref:uncharacterized protein LOC141892262 n=1 Tax=Acropora palmata TaxID=6131 RepID=UPI003DA0039C